MSQRRTNVEHLKLNSNPSDEQMKFIRKCFEDHNRKHPNGSLIVEPVDISLVLKNEEKNIIGGIITSMLYGVQHLEILWIEEQYRGRGYGRDLVLKAVSIAKKKGYSASQTWTLSFQAPGFYQKIGYKIVGVFNGYPDNITEYVLLRKFENDHRIGSGDTDFRESGFTVSEDGSEESMKILREGLGKHNDSQVGELRRRNQSKKINAVWEDNVGNVIGGASTTTTLAVLEIEHIWIDEKYRGQGLGKQLLLNIEKRATENGCTSVQGHAMLFQSPEFFKNCGYEFFGISDGYIPPLKEYFLSKKL